MPPLEPDHEEGSYLASELAEAKQQLYRLRVLDAYRTTLGEWRSHKNLLSYLTKGKPISEVQLAADLSAQGTRVQVLQALYDDHTARLDAWQEWVIKQGSDLASDPKEF